MTIGPEDTSEFLVINLMSQDNTVMTMKIKRRTRIEKLKRAYCSKRNMSVTSVRFLFDGALIEEDSTPLSLDLKEGDVIEVYHQMI